MTTAGPTRDDTATVCALAALAMVLATTAHEAIGHGGACLLAGGRIRLLTSVYFHCATQNRWISPAGPLGNLGAGALGLALFHGAPAAMLRTRLVALLLAGFSLFWFAGYLVYSMALQLGDFAQAVQEHGWALGLPLRAAAAAVGAVLYLASVRLVRTRLQMLAVHPRVPLLAWLAATVAAVAAAALYAPDRGGAMVQAGLEIGAASAPLLLMARFLAGAAHPVGYSVRAIAAGLIAFLLFAASLGIGISG